LPKGSKDADQRTHVSLAFHRVLEVKWPPEDQAVVVT
jgi:hypothetical protein